MKLVKIFGMVLALHVVLLTIFFLSPGCQSTPKTTVADPEPEPMPVVPVSENWSSQRGSSYAAGPASQTPAPLVGLTPAERARMSPTRPEDPDAFISTGSQPAVLSSQTSVAPSSTPTNYTVMAGDSLWKISRKFGTTVAEIMKVNAGLKADSLRPGDVISLPSGLPSPSGASPVTTTHAVTSSAANSTYDVKPGDSLSKIAARNGTTVAALRSANNLTSDVIQIGQTLVVPSGGDTAVQSSSTSQAGGGVTVTVQSGETLGEIARRFDVTVQELMSANGISDPRRVRAGQTLAIPGFEAVGGGTAAPPSTTRSTPPPSRQTTPPPPAIETLPSARQEELPDLDSLVPENAPVLQIEEPVPQP